MTKPPRHRLTPPYKRLSARVDRLEDAISHFYDVFNRIAQSGFDAGEEVKAQDEQTKLNHTSG
jgi:hypothetical protein